MAKIIGPFKNIHNDHMEYINLDQVAFFHYDEKRKATAFAFCADDSLLYVEGEIGAVLKDA